MPERRARQPRRAARSGARSQSPRRPMMQRLRAGFHHHQEVAVNSLQRLLREPGASLLTWLVIGIALALPLCLFLLLQNLQQGGPGLEQASRISLFMEQELEPAALDNLEERLLARADVAGVLRIDPDEALREFRQVSGFGEALDGLDENPLPAVLVLTPAAADQAALESMLAQLQDLPGVDFAQLDLEWLQRLYSLIDLARRMTLGLAGMLCLGVVLVVGNTVRLAIEGRRAEIVVVKLVGGTDAYVARPFLYTGLWYGVGGGLIAWGVAQLAVLALRGPVSRLAGLYGNSFSLAGIDIAQALIILLASGLLGWAGAWLSVLRHLRRIEPR